MSSQQIAYVIRHGTGAAEVWQDENRPVLQWESRRLGSTARWVRQGMRQKSELVQRRPSLPPTDPVVSAKTAGLRYVSDSIPGIRRERRGSGFRYIMPSGRPVRSSNDLSRIKSLVIPPAWQDVWICGTPNGHLQVTGRDARGRKQYRYHERWRQVRDETKYDRLLAFGRALPKIRQETDRHLSLPGLPRQKVLAAVVRLLEITLIRVGNEEYAKANASFGLTTMRDKHVEVKGPVLRFDYRGKSGIEHSVSITDRRLARIVKRSRDLPGYELFQYLDQAGERRTIESADVNEYLRSIAGNDFTAKDFRTWAGTVLAARALQELRTFTSTAHAKRNIVRAIEAVAKCLGNTKSVCRKCYIHPAVIDSYLDRTLIETLRQRVKKEMQRPVTELGPEEAAVIALLERRLASESQASA
jgi:DNA topoisomerase I